jgi:hypothetical protein
MPPSLITWFHLAQTGHRLAELKMRVGVVTELLRSTEWSVRETGRVEVERPVGWVKEFLLGDGKR